MNRHDRPLAIIIGGDTPTRAMLRFLLEDDGCVVAEAGDIEAVTAIPRAEDAALFALITGDHDRDAAGLLGRLRAKLAHPTVPHGYIRTAHGRGYSFDARSAPRLEQDVARPAGLQVLVVEDDRSTVEMIIEILRMAGYNVTSGVGPDAPALARQVQPHVILLDINMPGMDGVEVRRRLRGSPGTAGIPVIALSAAHNLRLRAGEMGADDYLTKPFSTDELLLRIARWVGRAPASDVASDGGTTPVTPAPGAASPAR